MPRSDIPPTAEAQLLEQLTEVVRKIGELTAEKVTLERLLMKVRERNQITKDVTRKNSLRRVLIENTILTELDGRTLYTRDIYKRILSTIYDLKYSTLRSHLQRMSKKNLIFYRKTSLKWELVRSPNVIFLRENNEYEALD
jgi:hypothetical protein